MPNDAEPAPVRIEYTPEFKRNLRQLAKRYRRIKTDLEPVLAALALGQTPGDHVPGITLEVFKIRARNTDSGKGKSGGYRILYQRTAQGIIVLVTLYSKAEQEDISLQAIRQILLEYANQLPGANEAESEADPSSPEKE